MNGIDADVNFIGQLRLLGRILEQSDVAEFWEHWNCPLCRFTSLGCHRTLRID